MAQNDQVSFTLDAYHKWAIERIADAMQTSTSDLMRQALREWMNRNQAAATGAGATLADFVTLSESGKR
jgi:predicted transcriptional regulator